jgi:signal transduction histidine kinase
MWWLPVSLHQRSPAWSRLQTTLVILVGILSVLVVTGWRIDKDIRSDMRYALVMASAQLSSLLAGYRMAEEYNPREILSLSTEELHHAVSSWPRLHAAFYLQAFETRDRLYFDSRTGDVRSYIEINPFSSTVHYGSWREEPFLYIDEDISGNRREILRTAITPRAYLRALVWGLLSVLAGVVALAVVLYFYREVTRRRRFGLLVGAMTKIVRRQTATKDLLIRELSLEICEMLGLDAVCVYLREEDRIVPRSCHATTGIDVNAFLRSTDQEPIMVDGAYPESVAMRENRPIMVDGARAFPKVHRGKFKAAGAWPYFIAPISGDRGSPIGLLTGQRLAGLRRHHREALVSCGGIAAILLENIRSREAFERMYRQTIRSTHTAALGMVVPNIAHNMRTPLVVIDELAKSIEKEASRLESPRLNEWIDGIKKQTELCFEEIRSISQYRKIGSSARRSVDLRQGLERVCGFLRDYFRVKGIDLEQRLCLKASPVIKMQELDFVQVITNLLINADEAFTELLDSEGHPTDHRKFKIEVVAEPEPAGSGVRISVIDNGPGIRQENLGKVFAQDFTTKAEGTGAGLAYCRHVVTEAGGRIEVRSTLGKGAAFTIHLPVQ